MTQLQLLGLISSSNYFTRGKKKKKEVFLKALSPEDGSALDIEGQILISSSKIKRTKSSYSHYAEKSSLLKSIP